VLVRRIAPSHSGGSQAGRTDAPHVAIRWKSPLLAQMRSADCIEQCQLSGVTRKTFAHTEFFSV
jgi:hypothetical protein